MYSRQKADFASQGSIAQWISNFDSMLVGRPYQLALFYHDYMFILHKKHIIEMTSINLATNMLFGMKQE
jgi:hypothetical protein